MIGITVNDRYTRKFVEYNDMANFEVRLKQAHVMLEHRTGEGSNMLGWMDIMNDIDATTINKIKDCANKIKRQAEVFIVIGIGGSYLGSKAVIDALTNSLYNLQNGRKRETPQILFVGNNLSGKYMQDLLDYIEDKEVCINVISKSGTTIEPAIAFRILKKHMEEKYGISGSIDRIYVTTDKMVGALKHIADKNEYETFVIPNDVGGRYSVLTPVGLLPIAVAVIDIQELLDGALFAKEVYSIDDINKNDCYKYALIRNVLYSKGKKIEMMATYEPSMAMFIEWWKQLFGESEGKNQKGIWPMGLNLTADLHSLGQQVQEGERNIFETVLNIQKQGSIMTIPSDKENLDGLNYIAGKDMYFVNKMAMEGTLKAHFDGNVPCIELEIPEITAYTIGQLIFFFEKACAISAYMLGVNPFNQPGVEKYKANMIELLRK